MTRYTDPRTGREYGEELVEGNGFAVSAHFGDLEGVERRDLRLADAVLAVAAEVRRLTEYLAPGPTESMPAHALSFSALRHGDRVSFRDPYGNEYTVAVSFLSDDDGDEVIGWSTGHTLSWADCLAPQRVEETS